ncbi:hypothetical protein [Algihabitans albus]|uniref:hypothetical protein n=1 Tax=Algihabitans albus TaxID=2164067 RepID=UPI000E5CA8C7|nr:hypothetical protein [Algihabitans albus]
MYRLTATGLAWLSACLIGLYIFDVPRLIIEIWALPLPLLGGRPPYLLPFVAVLFLAMVFTARYESKTQALYPVDVIFIVAWAIGAAVVTFHRMEAPGSGGPLLIDLAVFYSGFLLARAYRDAFGDLLLLLSCLFWMALAIAGVHLLLLLLHQFGLPALGANPGEFVQRNGISFLLVFACFYGWFLNRGLPPVAVHALLPGFALLHFGLNGARGGFVVLAILMAARYLLRADRSLRGAWLGLSITLAALLLLAFGLPLIQAHANALLGSSDDRLSAVSRLATNIDLMSLFAKHPMLGIGEAAVERTRFAGYMSHTFPIVLLVAFGLVGSVPFVIALWFMVSAEHRPEALDVVAITLVLQAGLFVNDLWPWLAVAAAATGLAVYRDRPKRSEIFRSPKESQM